MNRSARSLGVVISTVRIGSGRTPALPSAGRLRRYTPREPIRKGLSTRVCHVEFAGRGHGYAPAPDCFLKVAGEVPGCCVAGLLEHPANVVSCEVRYPSVVMEVDAERD